MARSTVTFRLRQFVVVATWLCQGCFRDDLRYDECHEETQQRREFHA
jgi:hypothetical protein